mgnify:FL=1
MIPTTAGVVARYLDGPAEGGAALTRNAHGDGVAWYLSTRLDAGALAAVMSEVYRDAGIERSDLPDGVEVVTRHGDDADYLVPSITVTSP